LPDNVNHSAREHRGFVPTTFSEKAARPKHRLSENKPTLPKNNPKTFDGGPPAVIMTRER
jgi:hypothetical protein